MMFAYTSTLHISIIVADVGGTMNVTGCHYPDFEKANDTKFKIMANGDFT